MGILEIYLVALAVIVVCITLLWAFSLMIRDSSIVDIFWGLGFIIHGWVYFLLADGFDQRKMLVLVLVHLWGLRLALHLARRNIGKGEDFRYQKFREQAGESYWWVSFFKVFLLQGVLMWLISAPLLGAMTAPESTGFNLLDVLGGLAWIVGFIFEAVGDHQLMKFRSDPANKGKILDWGLWRYTRHPNYFGDALQWWGFFLIACAAGAFWTIYAPVLMTVLLLRVSGVAMLERSLSKNKPGYAEYVAKTSAFIPMPPRNLS